MKFQSLLATSALSIPALAAAHNTLVVEIDSTQIKTSMDLAYLHRRLPFIGATFVPPNDRAKVVESLGQLKERVSAAGRLPIRARESVSRDIETTIKKIHTQLDKMPHVQNGAGDQPHQTGHGQHAEQRTSGH